MTNIDAAKVEHLFSHKAGYRFARWARPIVPVVFGVNDDTLAVMKTAIAQTVAVTGGKIEEMDPELGTNFMWFFCKEWSEIGGIPDLDKLVPNIGDMTAELEKRNLNSHRIFAFDEEGAIKLCVVMVRIKNEMADIPVHVLTTGETFFALALWGPEAFRDTNPIGMIEETGAVMVRPEYASVLRATYDLALPNVADDVSHAMRVAPRAQKLYDDLQNGA